MNRKIQFEQVQRCSSTYVLAINDTINAISGKWKLPIIGSLLYGKTRFKELERVIPKITPRMLSKELKDLEINGLITRTVIDTIPVTVEYQLTKSGEDFKRVLDIMVDWGMQHRKFAMTKIEKSLKEHKKTS
ncbi:putative HTH-type transcriptional regulator YtcD [compost metagenome]